MKANTTKQYLYRGDYYGYTTVTSADGLVTSRVYNTVPVEVSMALSVNLVGELLITSETKMQRQGYIRNIVDANDDEIYTNGEWEIVQTAPVLGPMGIKDGYKYRAQIINGDI